MNLLEFLILLLVAAVCGSIGQAIVGRSQRGCLISIAVGFVGALLGTWLARLLGVSEILAVRLGSATFPIVWSIAGSALFVAVLTLLTGRER